MIPARYLYWLTVALSGIAILAGCSSSASFTGSMTPSFISCQNSPPGWLTFYVNNIPQTPAKVDTVRECYPPPQGAYFTMANASTGKKVTEFSELPVVFVFYPGGNTATYALPSDETFLVTATP